MVTEKTWRTLVRGDRAPQCPHCGVPLERGNTFRVMRADGRLGLEHARCGEVYWTELEASPPGSPSKQDGAAPRPDDHGQPHL